MINIACVFNKQKNNRSIDYSIDWVDKLYRGISRNLDIPFKFTCLSNVDTPYNTIKLISNSDNYWNKIELFRKNLFDGPVLYFDLDVVICKNITDAVNNLPQNKMLMVQEPYKISNINIINSSVMFWSGDYSYLFDRYNKEKDSIVMEYSNPSTLKFGDQAYIRENVDYDLIENYTTDNFIQWYHHKLKTPITNPSILIFTSRQKPSNNTDLDLVKDHWV